MNAFGRVSRYLFLVSSIFLITGIFGYLYYSETVSKETYFNQLAFRKLGEVSRGLETNLKRLTNFTDQTRKNLKKLRDTRDAASDGTAVRDPEDFEIAKRELAYYLEDVDWSVVQEEVADSALELQGLLGLAGLVETSEFVCTRQSPSFYLDDASVSSLPEEFCSAFNFYFDLLEEMRPLAGMTSEQFSQSENKQRGEDLLEKMREGADISYWYLDGLSSSEEALEQWMEVNGLVEDLLIGLDILSGGSTRLRDMELKQNFLAGAQAYRGQLFDEDIVTALAGKTCLICTQEQQSVFRVQVEQELAWQSYHREENFHSLFYSFMLGFLADELQSMRDDFWYFVDPVTEASASAQRELAAYLKDGIDESSAAHDLSPRFTPDELCPLATPENGCDKLLFLSEADKESLYTGNNLAVVSYLTLGGKFEATLDKFLPQELREFSTLLIAASNGEVLQQTNSSADVVSHKFLNIDQFLRDALKAQKGEQSKKDKKGEEGDKDEKLPVSLWRTAYVDVDIGGLAHRVYIYPHEISKAKAKLHIGKNVNSEELIYVVGVKSLASITNEKLSISSGTSVLLLSAAMALLLAFVFLKIQLAHIDASFTRLEGAVAVASVVIFIVIAMIGSYSLALSQQVQNNVRDDAVSSLRQLKERFGSEIESQLVQIDALLTSDRSVVKALSGSEPSADSESESVTTTTIALIDEACLQTVSNGGVYLTRNLPPNPELGRSYPLENLFMLKDKGELAGPLVRGSRHMARPFKGNLRGRRYFQKALANDVWEFEVKNPGQHGYEICSAMKIAASDDKAPVAQWFPFFLERIFNLGDGTLSTQLSMPIQHEFAGGQLYHADKRYQMGKTDVKVISAGLTLRTFQAPIMPHGQSFAVVDDATGQVLYHSDDSRSLVENFFQETENDVLLRAYIRAAPALKRSSGHQDSRFTGLYRGQDTEFFVDKLHPAIPWSLVVFQDASEGQGVVPVVFSVAMLMTISIVLVVALLLSLGGLADLHITNWLWPQIGKLHVYPRAAGMALAGNVLYYIVLMQPLGTFSLISAIVVITVFIFWWFRRYFQNSQTVSPEDPGNASPPEALQHRYLLFMMSLLVLLTAAPVAQIVNKVDRELLQRVIAYDAVQQEEAAAVAYTASNKRISRLCGAGAYQRGSFAHCRSIIPSALGRDVQQNEASKRLVSGTQGLLQPTNLMADRECTYNRIYCGGPRIDDYLDVDEIGVEPLAVTEFPLELLRQSRWQLPVMLEAVSPAKGTRQVRSELGGTHVYPYRQNFSSVLMLLLNSPLSFLLLIVALLITAGAIYFLAASLLGIGLPRSYRAGYQKLNNQNWKEFASGKILSNEFEKDYGALREQLMAGDRKFAILIRPAQARLNELLKSMEEDAIHLDQDRAPLDSHSLAASEAKRTLLENQLRASTDKRRVLVLESLEAVAFDSPKRRTILDLLEAVTNSGDNVSVLLVCDVAPLYMLTHQDRYVPNSMSDAIADAQESMRWSRLLSQFDKYYGWSPMDLDFTETGKGARLQNTLLRECSSWPELYYLKEDLDVLQQQHKDLLEEQAIQYISTHAGPIYRRRWSFCTKEEKLLLYQLAKGQMINPMNREPLEHLMRRGFIRRDPKWSIVSESFSRFVLTAEDEQIYLKWMTASEQGLWKILRVPLFTIALMILGILMYSAQETMESMLALATSALAFLPLLLRSFAMVGGPKTPPPPPTN